MNNIIKQPVGRLGYDFIDARYLPAGKDEYYLRFEQNPGKERYRALTRDEIGQLIVNRNTSANWDHVLVDEHFFDPSLVHGCKFYGLVRIGKMEPLFLEFHNLRLPAGLYNSTIISSDIGDHVVIDNVNFMSHYIIGNEVILVNVHELSCTDHAKFGNGLVKEGEKESVRIWVELCNENAGRRVLPFDGMQAADAWMWTRYRADETLMNRFLEFTEKKFDNRRGYYGMIGDRTVIKNTAILKDVKIGSDAYIKGANKLKNLTINSSESAHSQIGEGCELVNGIIGYGCRVFYGVKAVRFMLASHSQLKYGARLINSYLGDNSTISCCEVLNSLIFPAHEQHHNNSFLCAALVMGQSNMAAGATIGSNHNSRGADGELVAGRGFWPGLCVSLKHNSKFASFNLLAKGDFPAELNIPIPFSLVSNDVTNNRLVIMPAYWFQHNMYALARNAGKYNGRDKRRLRNQYLEYDYLAPDSVNEMMRAMDIIAQAVGESREKTVAKNKKTAAALIRAGKELLESKKDLGKAPVFVQGFENSTRPVELVKAKEAWRIFRELIVYYGMMQLIELIEKNNISSHAELIAGTGLPFPTEWINLGGQLVPEISVNELTQGIRSGIIGTWDEVHAFYHRSTVQYPKHKMQHAFHCMLQVLNSEPAKFTSKFFIDLLEQALQTREWMTGGIYTSREKDYNNPFRKMVYESDTERDVVVGALKDNHFIKQQEDELAELRSRVERIAATWKKNK